MAKYSFMCAGGWIKPTHTLRQSRINSVNFVKWGGLLLVALTGFGCDDSQSNTPSTCIPECLDEDIALVCVNDQQELDLCVERNLKCFDGICAASSNVSCTDAPRECVGKYGYRICANGFWSTEIECTAGQACVNGKCIPETDVCEPNDKQCSSDNKGYRVCESGSWSEVIECKGTTVCKDGACSGEEVVSKLPCGTVGEQICVSSTRVQVCGHDKYWEFMDCPEEIPVCDFHNNVCSTSTSDCTNGEVKCLNDNTLATCMRGTWDYSKCPDAKPVCSDKQCVERPKECEPGEKKCDSLRQSKICSKDGLWIDGDYCSGSTSCLDGECTYKCAPDTMRCVSSSSREICSNSGKWVYMVCNYVCSSDKCAKKGEDCDEVASTCQGDNLYYCDGKTVDLVYCRSCKATDDNTGATCVDTYDSGWDDASICTSLGATKSGVFGNLDRATAECLKCMRMKDGSTRWVPVNQSNCK